MDKEVLITKEIGGRIGNQLWGLSPFIVRALIEDRILIIPNLSPYFRFFKNLNQFSNIIFIQKDNKISFPDKIDSIKLLDCWREGLDIDLSTKFAELHTLFAPHPKYASKVAEEFSSKRKLYDTIVGVHMRKTDYDRWMSGLFYYSDLVYVSYMKQIKDMFKEVGFFLCSDAPMPHDKYRHFNTFSIDNACGIEDMYGLSLCDYIIGPPSTFSSWAAFYGKTPLCLLTSPNSKITLDKFSVPVSHDKLSNGEVASYFMNQKEDTIYLW